MKLIPDKMNWDRETSNKNYCGYCIDVTCVCDGTCFREGYANYESNRKDHIEIELVRSRKRTEQLEKELQNNYEKI